MARHLTMQEVAPAYETAYVVRVVELPGCLTQAGDFTELGEMIEEAMRAWIETALEDGYPIPKPRTEEGYSGKFVDRLPRSLHRELTKVAEREGVSRNALVNVALARFVGAESASEDNTTEHELVSETRFVPS